MNRTRKRVFYEMKKNYKLVGLCPPKVHWWRCFTFGRNTFIFFDNMIQPIVEIGDKRTLWSGNHIVHHLKKNCSHCFVLSHVVISGLCRVGSNVFTGPDARPHWSIAIADYGLIVVGAIKKKYTPANGIYAPKTTKLFAKNIEEVGF